MNIMELVDVYAKAKVWAFYQNKQGWLYEAIEAANKAEPEARATVLEALEKLAKDAARYQWMREYLPSDDVSCDEAIVAALTPEELDAAIDAAMEATNGQGN